MASGKRASMREGPLAALFRKTETDGLEDDAARRAPQPAEAAARSRRAGAAPRRSRRGAPRADAAGAPAPRVLLRPPGEHDGPALASPRRRPRPTTSGAPAARVARPAQPHAARRRRRRRRRERRQPHDRGRGPGRRVPRLQHRRAVAAVVRRAREAPARRATSRAGSAPAPTPTRAAPPRWRTPTGSSRCCAARTWCSSPPARAAAPARAPRPWWRASPASSAR